MRASSELDLGRFDGPTVLIFPVGANLHSPVGCRGYSVPRVCSVIVYLRCVVFEKVNRSRQGKIDGRLERSNRRYLDERRRTRRLRELYRRGIGLTGNINRNQKMLLVELQNCCWSQNCLTRSLASRTGTLLLVGQWSPTQRCTFSADIAVESLVFVLPIHAAVGKNCCCIFCCLRT